MKKILLLAFLINLCSFSFAQKTNSRGEYLVKTATWKSYGQGSFKMDLEYSNTNELIKISKKYIIGNNKVIEYLTLKNENGKYLKYIRYVNGKQNFSVKTLYNFNKNDLITNISWIAPSKNKLMQTFQMFYNDNRELVKMIKKTTENGGQDWNNETVTKINWEGGNIVSDREVNDGDEEYPHIADFVYYPKEEIVNNTNLNFNFLIMYSYCRIYMRDIVMGTEWFGRNTNLILRSTKDDLKRTIYGNLKKHYEYELDGELIKELRFISPIVGKAPYIYGTLTLEYVY